MQAISPRDMVCHHSGDRDQPNQQEEMRMSKDGLCAIVTGSASGLGAATAAILAKGGARIVVNYSSSKKEAEADRRSLPQGRRRSGRGAGRRLARRGLQEDRRRRRAAGAGSMRSINNAGTTKHVPHDDLDGLSAEDFQRIYAVNTIGPFQMIRAARSLLEAGAKASGQRVGGGQRLLGRRHSAAAARRSPMPRARARSTP